MCSICLYNIRHQLLRRHHPRRRRCESRHVHLNRSLSRPLVSRDKEFDEPLPRHIAANRINYWTKIFFTRHRECFPTMQAACFVVSSLYVFKKFDPCNTLIFNGLRGQCGARGARTPDLRVMNPVL